MSSVFIDARNLLCPMPVIRTQDRVAGLQQGELVEVLCTDPGVVYDIPAWCRMRGHEVCNIEEQEYEITITIRVGDKG